MPVERQLRPVLERRARSSPVVVLTGPRQSGKTTLVRTTFARKPYANLEAPDVRQRALSDPRGFLEAFPDGAVLDEVQRAPELLSYIQVDVGGIACYLLGIRNAEELRLHPLRGAIFETWAVSEILKAHQNLGHPARLSFFRDAHGLEVDVLIERSRELVGFEVKSGATVPVEAFAPLESVARLLPDLRTCIVLHGGSESWSSKQGRALSYREIDRFDWVGRG